MNEIKIAKAWQRIFAGAIDMVFVVILVILIGLLIPITKLTASIFIIPYVTVAVLYPIVLHAKLGKTIGKAAFGIQVVKLNGEKIGWYEAFKRSAVDVLLQLPTAVTFSLLVWQLPYDHFQSHNWVETVKKYIEPNLPSIHDLFVDLGLIWTLSEFVTMFFNKNRRALHDFIAGTIVVKS